VPFYADAAGHAAGLDVDTVSGSTSLYRDGQLLGSQNLAGKGTFWVGQNEAEYRLVTEATRNEPWWPLSTKISAEWTFRSSFRPGPFLDPLPLLAIRAEPPVNLANQSPTGPVTIPLTVTRQDGPTQITAVELEFSTDDGATWQQTTVSRSGDHWQAAVSNSTGYVSLRTKATDTDGNAVRQTIIRAYQV
jgi:hypothetical protein